MNPQTSAPEDAAPRVFTPVSPSELAPAAMPETLPPAPEMLAPPPETAQPAAEIPEPSPEIPEPSPETPEPSPETPEPSPEMTQPAPETLPPVIPQDNPALSLSFSPAPDAPFQSSLALSLICARHNALIRYALGAGDVGEDGLLFDSKDKILLTQTTLVAARAFENGERGPLLLGTFEIKKPLWQQLEPADQSDATPHQLGANGVCDDGWKIGAGSVRGKLHAHRGLWREDSFAFSSAPNGEALWQIVAVSDGAGSAPLSRVGSQIACDAAISALQISLGNLPAFSNDQNELQAKNLPLLRDALTQSASAALEAIRAQAAKRGQPLAAFAATLLVLARREWNSAQLCASLQVGDGAIALWDEAGLTLLGVADHGQNSGETRFLTTNGIEAELGARVKFSIKADLRALALMSDGVSDDYFPEEKWLGGVFEAVLPLLKSENDGGAALVSWLGYEKKGSSDDRTLVVSWKEGSE